MAVLNLLSRRQSSNRGRAPCRTTTGCLRTTDLNMWDIMNLSSEFNPYKVSAGGKYVVDFQASRMTCISGHH
ncbi:hypothetical protein L6164_020335 [Bauhinia variegata]|uniref:Uncharacterized protein n=1 Tax=Bauhinia variegata TaxID=167791 RepID=A0ACB9MW28_BAUVA|nr:hypothetical protein L6164_020335 [Bauhinia variegata]